MTMGPNGGLSASFHLAILLILGTSPLFPGASQSFENRQDMLGNVGMALLDPMGRELSVRWHYSLEGESWSGEGTLEILGRDYLRLILPHQTILIKESTIMAWYRETDQVIIDFFDRQDPSNLFSILLGNFDDFSVYESEMGPDATVTLKLLGEALVGFKELELTVDEETWMPRVIVAKSGDGLTATIHVENSSPLLDREALRNATLEGTEVIDFRQ